MDWATESAWRVVSTEVARLGGLHGRIDALPIPDFAHEDDIGILAHGVADAIGKGGGIDADLALLELGLVILEHVLDGIFNRDDAQGLGLVDVLDQGAQGRALALASRTGRQNDAARFLDQLGQGLGQLQVLEFQPLLGNGPEREGLQALLLAEIGPIPLASAVEAQVHFELLLDPRHGRRREVLRQHRHELVSVRRRKELGRDAAEFAVDANAGRFIGLDVQVGRGLLLAPIEYLPQFGVGPDEFHGRGCQADLPQHFLNFLPLPHGHGSFRPTLGGAI